MRIEEGQGRPEDMDSAQGLAGRIKGRTICAFGDAAAMAGKEFLKHFRDEFEYHVDHKRCMPDGPGPDGSSSEEEAA